MRIEQVNSGREYVMMCGQYIMPSFNLEGSRMFNYKKIYSYLFNKNEAENFELDQNKGLYLYGDTRSGKTTMIRVMQLMIAMANPQTFSSKRFEIIHMDILKRDFRERGDEIFKEHEFHQKDIAFDEIFRNENLMQQRYTSEKTNLDIELVFERSRQFDSNRLLTYMTSNAPIELVEEKQGAKVSRRINEMCNIVII